MTKFEMVDRRAEVAGARAFFRTALKRYEAAMAMVAKAKADLDRYENEYRKVEMFAAA